MIRLIDATDIPIFRWPPPGNAPASSSDPRRFPELPPLLSAADARLILPTRILEDTLRSIRDPPASVGMDVDIAYYYQSNNPINGPMATGAPSVRTGSGQASERQPRYPLRAGRPPW